MGKFFRYQHVESFGRVNVKRITEGYVYVFPKLDGANAQIWLDDNGVVCVAGRDKQYTETYDPAGLWKYAYGDNVLPHLLQYFNAYPNHILYGEWLIKHTIQYVADALNKFYIFDVAQIQADDSVLYLSYDDYTTDVFFRELTEHVSYVRCLWKGDINDPATYITNSDFSSHALFEYLRDVVNTYLMPEGEIGEGIVIKRYNFRNKQGEMQWAKMVRTQFKLLADHDEGTASLEQSLAATYVSTHIIDKVVAKLVVASGLEGYENRMIPKMLDGVFDEIVQDEIVGILSKHKNPIIDFKAMKAAIVLQIKLLRPELF